MPLRRTESSLPEAYKYGLLGETITSEDEQVALVCGIPPHLVFDEGEALFSSDDSNLIMTQTGRIEARYAAFVRETNEASFANYAFRWTVYLEKQGSLMEYQFIETEDSCLKLSIKEPTCTLVHVYLEIWDAFELRWTLDMKNLVRPPNKRMEKLYTQAVGVMAGNISVSRMLINFLWGEILHALSPANPFDPDVGRLPQKLLGAILYLILFHDDKSSSLAGLDKEDDYIREILNRDEPDYLHSGILRQGVGRLIKAACDAFFGTSDEKYLDFYNILRFPRGAACYCAAILSRIKKAVPARANLSADELLADGQTLRAMAKDFFTAMEFRQAEGMADVVGNIIYYPFLMMPLDPDPRDETIRIQVRNCRSGDAVGFARVRSIRIPGFYEVAFPPDSQPIVKAGAGAGDAGKILDSQKALMGFAKEGKDRNGLSIWTQKYPIRTARDAYDRGDARAAFNQFWADRGNTFVSMSLETPYDPGDAPLGDICEKITDAYNAQRATDILGMLEIRIPRLLLLAMEGLTIEVGFHDFPVALGKLKSETRAFAPDTPLGEATGYQTVWLGLEQQSLAWGGSLGWALTEGSRSVPLKVSESMEISIYPREEEIKFVEEVFSHRYSNAPGSIHFELYAMLWCQPVWDGVSDPPQPETARSNQTAFVNQRYGDGDAAWVKDLNTHLVSMTHGSARNPYGHYYGFFANNPARVHRDNNRNGVHQGVDLYTGSNGNDLCFAAHGGWMNTGTAATGYGNRVQLFMQRKGDGYNCFYAHLSAFFLAGNPVATQVFAGQRVLCGQVIARAGASGIGASYPLHMHFEVRRSIGSTQIDPVSIPVDTTGDGYRECSAEDRRLLPGNRLPLMLPCKCTYSNGANAVNCAFSGTFFRTCWAVQEFPYGNARMLRSANQIAEDMPALPMPLAFLCPAIFQVDISGYPAQTAPRTAMHREAQLQANLLVWYHRAPFTINTALPADPTLPADAPLLAIDGSAGQRTRGVVKLYLQQTDGINISDADADRFIDIYVNGPSFSGTDAMAQAVENLKSLVRWT